MELELSVRRIRRLVDAGMQYSERRAAKSPGRLSLAQWGATVKRVFHEFNKDSVTDWAAALTYYGVLSIFPGLLVLFSVVGLLGETAANGLQQTIEELAPGQVGDFLLGAINQVRRSSGAAGILAVVGLLVAFWSASSYIGAFMRASNAIYDVPEGRPLWRRKLPLRLAVTAGVGLMLLVSTMIVVFTGDIAQRMGSVIGLGTTAVTVWDIAKWPVLLVLVSLTLSLLYWATPNARHRFRVLSPGGLFAVLLWVMASAGFAYYLANFASYNKTYGTIAGVIVFLIWLWLTNIAVLLGAEIDAERERGRAIAAGHDPREEPYLELRDDRALPGTSKGDDAAS